MNDVVELPMSLYERVKSDLRGLIAHGYEWIAEKVDQGDLIGDLVEDLDALRIRLETLSDLTLLTMGVRP